jgi:hypothetical protein
MFSHPAIQICLAFTVFGMISLLAISTSVLRGKSIMKNKIFTIVLNEEQIDYLTYEYQMVELTVEEILKQVKAQGYVDPEQRGDTKGV